MARNSSHQDHSRDGTGMRKRRSASSAHPARGPIVLIPAFAFLVSCAGWEVRPESAVILAPVDEVWVAARDVLQERSFQIVSHDNRRHVLRATKDLVLRTISDRTTRAREDKEHHEIDLAVAAHGADRSVVEVVYRIEKLVVVDPAFGVIAAVRDRVAARAAEQREGARSRR
jgi:hypothetical protein